MKNCKTFYEAQTASGNYSVSEIQKLYCKMSDIFRYSMLALRWSPTLSDDVHWNVWTNIESFMFWSRFHFWRLL